jgi:serine/threonine protein kinase
VAKWIRLKQLPSGGQAQIYLVKETGQQTTAVMKKLFPAPQLADPAAELRRFRREVRCQSSLRHPDIMPILSTNFQRHAALVRYAESVEDTR